MDVLETYGHAVESLSVNHPRAARWLLKTGWELQYFRFRHFPDENLNPADQYMAYMLMDTMLRPLKDPENTAMVSIFTPAELVQEVGLHPYNVEGFSCYLAGSRAEKAMLRHAESDGIAETLCSYHKTFIGAAEYGILPKPKCIIYTNLTCDANMLTFKRLAEFFRVPCFFLDVPFDQTEENVAYVAEQFEKMKEFLEQVTGKTISEESLTQRLERSQRTIRKFDEFQRKRADRFIPNDLTSPYYCALSNNLLLGTRRQETYVDKCLEDLAAAPESKGLRIYWMHTIPFRSEETKKLLRFQEKAQIVGDELAQFVSDDFDPQKPYEALARRVVYHAMNGSVTRRIENGIKNAKAAGADGVVWFNHWGCKHTMGGSLLAKEMFEAAGLPCLILDGDGCDTSHGGEGQTATRLGAFLELLEEKKQN